MVWLACCAACGLLPGTALFVDLFAKAGIFGSQCAASEHHRQSGGSCKEQVVALTAVSQAGTALVMMFMAPIGLIFDRWGSRNTGTLGAAIAMAGFLIVSLATLGAESGYGDEVDIVFITGTLVCDFGSMLNSFSFMGLIWHFPDKQALLLTLINATYQVSAFLPLLMEAVMHGFGSSLSMVLLAYACVVGAACVVCWFAVPNQQEYYAQAKSVLGMPLPRPPKNVDFCGMIQKAWAVLRMDTRAHMASGAAMTFAFALPYFYASLATGYGEALFGRKEDGTRLAELCTSSNGIVGLALAPFVGSLADSLGLKVFLGAMAIILAACTALCGIGSWAAQIVVACLIVLFMALLNLFMSRYILQYAPPNRFGAVQGLYTMSVMLAAGPVSGIGLSMVDVLPRGPDAYRWPMYAQGIAGTIALSLYAVYYHFNPPPEVPSLLDEDEKEIAKGFRCQSFEEVMEVVRIPTRRDLLKALSNSDPAAMKTLVRSIDPEKMMEVMARRPVEDIAQMMEESPDADEDDDDDIKTGTAELVEVAVKTEATNPTEPLLSTRDEANEEPEECVMMGVYTSEDDRQRRHSKFVSDPIEMSEVLAEGEVVDAPPGGGQDRVRARADELEAALRTGDKAAVNAYLLECPIDEMLSVSLWQEEHLSDAEMKAMDKQFSKLVPGSEFAKILRQRPELREVVQQAMKRAIQRRVKGAGGSIKSAFGKGKK